jgi:hypothetical protein
MGFNLSVPGFQIKHRKVKGKSSLPVIPQKVYY